MRIGMILDKPFPPDPRVENEAVALMEKGHELYLFCVHSGNKVSRQDHRGIQVVRYPYSKIHYKMSALAYTVPCYEWLMAPVISDFLEAFKIEAVHIHDMRIAGAVFRAMGSRKLKTVLDLHDNFPEVMKDYPHLKKFPGKWLISPSVWKKKEGEFMAKADKVVSVSGELVRQLQDRLDGEAHKVVLVPNTVRRDFYEKYELKQEILDRFREDFVLLYIGDTAVRRGLLTVIEALPAIRQEVPTVKLVIVGRSTEDHILKTRVSDLGLADAVSFEGWQQPASFPSYILASAICLSPLIRSAQHDVAYANKLFQYMSFARPLLVSDALAQRRLVEDQQAGLVHREKDARDLAEKVLTLHADPDLRNALGAHGKRFIEEEFRWALVSDNLCNIYKEFG